MKNILIVMTFLSFTNAFATSQKCEVLANGITIPNGSFIEIDNGGPMLSLFWAKEQGDGSFKYIKMPLISADVLTSWKITRKSAGCSERADLSDGLNFQFSCKKVSSYQDVRGFLLYRKESGHYYQSALTNGGATREFEFDFYGCK